MLAQPTHSNQQLAVSIAAGDENAFREFFHQYHHHLGTYLFKLTESRELAEEIVQDVFLKIWVSREKLPEVKDIEAWMFALSKNHALNCLRKQIRERVQQKSWALTQQSGEEETEWKEQQFQLIDEAIGQLPPQQKKAFLLRRYKKMKYEEIAVEMNLSRETVKTYLRIARTHVSKFVNSRFSPVFWIVLPFYW